MKGMRKWNVVKKFQVISYEKREGVKEWQSLIIQTLIQITAIILR